VTRPQDHTIIAAKESIMNHTATPLVASFSAPSRLLRRALLTDATLTALAGVGLALAANQLASLLQLPTGVLRISGMLFIPFAALAAWLGTRDRVHRPLVFAVITLNALFALDLLLVLFGGWVETNLLGELFIAAHAVVCGVLAEAEFLGLRRSTLVQSYARR
jgi:hypothetical protein